MKRKVKISLWLMVWVVISAYFFFKYATEYELCIDVTFGSSYCKLGTKEGLAALTVVSIIYNILVFGGYYIFKKKKSK